MASRYDIFNQPNSGPNWKTVIFPGASSHALPVTKGVYRFVCCKLDKLITLFVAISEEEPCDTIRASYLFHDNQQEDNDSPLAELYSTDELEFEHFSCSISEAERHKNNLLVREKPIFNSYRFVICYSKGTVAF